VAAITTGIVSNLVQAGTRHSGGGIGSAIGLAIGIGAAALGLALARAVGRQGKI
jgi:thymidine phosphorylase